MACSFLIFFLTIVSPYFGSIICYAFQLLLIFTMRAFGSYLSTGSFFLSSKFVLLKQCLAAWSFFISSGLFVSSCSGQFDIMMRITFAVSRATFERLNVVEFSSHAS